MSLIKAQDLALGYDNQAIVENINFSVEAGDYLCIVGENGSGKTTLMKTLLHLKEPAAGTIETGDGLKSNEIGYLPQQTVVQRDFPAAVSEIVISGCQSRMGLRPFYNKEEKKLAADSMERRRHTGTRIHTAEATACRAEVLYSQEKSKAEAERALRSP